MAKKRSPNAVLEETADSFALLTPDEPAQAPAVAEPPAVETTHVTLTVPLRPPVKPRYHARHVEVQLDNDQALALSQLFEALDHGGQRLKSGRRVTSAADALRWLLEKLDAP